MRVAGKRAHGVILAALILVSLVLVLLVTALVTSGTSSLRTTTLVQQSDVAAYAAEAGLAEAAEEYRRTGKLATNTFGELEGSQATYQVRKYENVTTTSMQISGGPSIPPSTLYLLSEGISPNGTREKAGALFRTGLGVFQAGVVSDSMVAEKARFDAYDSTVSKKPEESLQPDRGILASKRADPTKSDPQYGLTDTVVEGGVYVAPGTTAEDQIRKAGATEVSREGTLASPITIDPIKVPTLLKGGVTEGGTTTTESFDPSTYSPGSWRLQDLKVTYNAGSQRFTLKDDGGLLGSSTVGHITIAQLQAAAQATPPVLIVDDGEGRRTTLDFEQNKITYRDPAGDGKGTWNQTMPSIFGGAVQPPEVDTVNPDTMGPGAYSTVTIDDDTPTRLSEGTYVIRDLTVTGNGKLECPADGKVTLFVTGRLKAEGENALINDSRLPTGLKIFYTGDNPVNLAGGALSYMTLVAPQSEIKLEGMDPDKASVLYGALVGKSVTVINADLHFDVATDGVGTGTDGGVLTLLNRHRL
jgi:hypothetical protein